MGRPQLKRWPGVPYPQACDYCSATRSPALCNNCMGEARGAGIDIEKVRRRCRDLLNKTYEIPKILAVAAILGAKILERDRRELGDLS